MLIKVKVFPAAGKAEIIKKSEDSFEVWVKEKPVQGQATKATAKALANFFKIPCGQVRLIKGARERNKIFEIEIK